MPVTDNLRTTSAPNAIRCSSAYSAFSGALTGFGSDIQDLGVVDMSTTFSILLVIAAVRVAPS